MTTETREYVDTIFISMPRSASAAMVDPEVTANVTLYLSAMAEDSLIANYPHSVLLAIEWQFFTEVQQAIDLELPHICDDCQEGKDKAIVILSTHPDQMVAFGTMYVSEPRRAKY